MSKRSIVHVEIPAANWEESANFYADLFGWEYQHQGEPYNYTLFVTGNGGGGYAQIGEEIKAGDVRVYISSDDIDTDLRNIEARGGKTVVPKTEIPNFGWMAWFTDPAGNTMALWQSAPGAA